MPEGCAAISYKISGLLTRLLIIFCCVCVFNSPVAGQLLIYPVYTPSQQQAVNLAHTLAGPGVTVFNATMNCQVSASGLFSGVNTNLGIDSGILLTNGYAKSLVTGTVIGADGPQSLFSSFNFSSFTIDPDLNGIFPNASFYDGCFLEFDFIPLGDTVKFDYVFGSEEYPGYSCSSYNDVFGFFISGPGYTGSKNIALIPGTNIPVCINSTTGLATGGNCAALGPGAPFSQYYVNNTGGTTITYDGFTTVLKVVAGVVPCDTFHLKLGVADVDDGQLNSAVFLKAGSFISPGVSVQPYSGQGLSDIPASYCIRECKPGRFRFRRPSLLTSPLTLHFTIAGTAINGADYVHIADSVIIPANDTVAEVLIQGLAVPNPTGPRSVKIFLQSPYPCMPSVDVDSAVLFIYDSLDVKLHTPDTAICLGASFQLIATGDPALQYNWSPIAGLSDPSIIDPVATPLVSTVYVLTAQSQDTTCPAVHPGMSVDVQPVPQVAAGADISVCFNDTVGLHGTVTPAGYPLYTYSWQPAGGFNDPHITDPIFDAQQTSNATFTVTTPAGCIGSDNITIYVTPAHFMEVSADTGICPRDTIAISVRGGLSREWHPDRYISSDTAIAPMVWPITDVTYTVVGVDTLGCIDSGEVTILVHPSAVIHLTDSVRLFPGESFQMAPDGNCLYFSWFPPLGLDNAFISNPLAAPPVSTRYFVSAQTEYGCRSLDSINVIVDPETRLELPNAFSPGGGPNGTFKIIKKGQAALKYFRVYNRWGNKLFEANNIDEGWDGSFNGKPQPMGVYIYTVEAVADNGRLFRKQGNVTLLR